jgi:DNA-binding response OmpR family regulator
MNRRPIIRPQAIKKILVVDDDKKIVAALAIRLKAAGYEVLTAPNGLEGLKLAVSFRPNLIISDVWMPDGVGFIAAQRLKHLGLADVPVIFITASRKQDLWSFAQEVGASALFEKPYDSEKLLAAVAGALQAQPASPAGRPDTSQPQVTASVRATAADNSLAGHPDSPQRPPRITGKNKILIVEDDRKIAMALALRLRAGGQDVLLAYDAVTGLDSAIKNQPDLVLLDIGLPSGSGLVVAESIQKLACKHTPIMFLTASRQPGLRDKAMALGAAGFLEKPFEAGELMAAIQNALTPPDDQSLAPKV